GPKIHLLILAIDAHIPRFIPLKPHFQVQTLPHGACGHRYRDSILSSLIKPPAHDGRPKPAAPVFPGRADELELEAVGHAAVEVSGYLFEDVGAFGQAGGESVAAGRRARDESFEGLLVEIPYTRGERHLQHNTH
ncbi:hypothetical protein GP486_008963, partial [Trichoglossum hirsutum]